MLNLPFEKVPGINDGKKLFPLDLKKHKMQTAALKGLNLISLIFSPFRAAADVSFAPCVSRTVIQILPLQGIRY